MKVKQKKSISSEKCGLCKSAKNPLVKTECCGNWICDDAHTYIVFSYARNSCYRNHDRYTLCAYHFHEGHDGKWQDCKKCKDNFDAANYHDYVTNAYNFEKLKNINPVKIECTNCNFTSTSINDFALQTSEGYFCGKNKCQNAAWK